MHTFVVLAYKESEYLEECIKSVLNQSESTNVVIATSTPNKYIDAISKKYNLKVLINDSKEKGIGKDFNFAVHCVDTKLVTIAHQDDIYDFDYVKKITENYKKYDDSIILFTDYYEIRKNQKVYSNFNLKIKRLLLSSLRIKKLSHLKINKRNVLRFGNSICCPAVTFVGNKRKNKVFNNTFKCNVDWEAWEILSRKTGKFIYIREKLVGHRVDDSTTTSDIIKQGIRTKEDLEMFKKFWPYFIAKIINKLYKNSERSNIVKE